MRVILLIIIPIIILFSDFHTPQVYAESHHVVPNQHKTWIIVMGTIFFTSWGVYPILFIFGQEGFRLISHPLANGLMGATDLISKNLWGFMGWKLRRMLFRFIAEYGNPQTIKLAQEHRLDLADLYYNDGQVMMVPASIANTRHTCLSRLTQSDITIIS